MYRTCLSGARQRLESLLRSSGLDLKKTYLKSPAPADWRDEQLVRITLFAWSDGKYIVNMGLFDALRRGKKPENPPEDGSSEASASAHFQEDQFSSNDRAFSSEFDGTHAINTASSDFGATSGSFASGGGERLYNPYEGISAALDRRDVKAPFRLPQEPEFLFSEESIVQRRSWSENLTYYTGVGYLAGAAAGGGVGVYRVLLAPTSIPGQGGLPSQRIRINQLLNTSGKMGRSAGNALGVLGLLFSSSESFYYYMNDRILPEDLMTVAAGGTTGAIYRSVRGPRQALAAGAVGSIGGLLLLGARKFISSGL